MLPQSVLVEGLIIGSQDGTGLADRSIEAWSLDEEAFSPLAEARSDAQGMFVLDLPLVPGFEVEGGIARIEFRILDRSELILAEIRELALDQGPQPMQFFVPDAAPPHSGRGEVADPDHDPHEVHGRVWGPVVEGTKVRGVLNTLRRDDAGYGIEQASVGETPVDKRGAFNLAYNPSIRQPAAAETRLELQLRGPEDELLVASEPVDMTRQRARIDLQMPGSQGAPSEYELLADRLHGEIEAGPAILDGLSPEALFELADEIDVEPDRLELLQRARGLKHETGLPAAMFYALGRNGMSIELEDLIDVPREELRATIIAAADDMIVNESMVPDLEALLAELAERVRDRVLEADPSTMGTGLGEIMASADLPRDTVRAILQRYQARTAGVQEFWESLVGGDAAHEAVDEDVRSELELAVDIGGLLGAESALVREMLALRRQGRWQTLKDLAAFDFDEWCEILESLEPPDASHIMEVAAPIVGGEPEWTGEDDDPAAGFQNLEADTEEYEDAQLQTIDAVDDIEAAALDGDLGDLLPDDGYDEDALDAYEAFDPAESLEDDPDDLEEEEEQDGVEARAEAILDTLEEAFPSEFILNELQQSGELSEDAHRLLDLAGGHDFL
ncbi:MAG: hypothetical protein QNJ04_06930, partial [Desulfobacterales bacterium]|nr:hypothetical protein [Desulfobacterales bacterium]